MSIQICLNCIDFLKLDFTVAQRSGVIFPPYRGNARNEASQKSIFPLLRVCVHCEPGKKEFLKADSRFKG